MKITIEEQVLDYAKKNQLEGIVVENTPVGCSCVGIHIHAQPEYIAEIEKYQNNEKFEGSVWEGKLQLFFEKTLLPIEEISIFGKLNPFNKKMYLHCEVKKV